MLRALALTTEDIFQIGSIIHGHGCFCYLSIVVMDLTTRHNKKNLFSEAIVQQIEARSQNNS